MQFLDYLLSIKEHRFPLLVAYADNDKLIGLRNFDQMLSVFGQTVDDAASYDLQGQLEYGSVLPKDHWLSLIRFKEGNHFAFIKYPELINQAVEEHLKKIKKLNPQISAKEHRTACQL